MKKTTAEIVGVIKRRLQEAEAALERERKTGEASDGRLAYARLQLEARAIELQNLLRELEAP